VGWYQSTYMGTYSTNEVVGYQHNYQSSEDLSDNSVVILYDPIQSRKGHICVKALRLSDEYMELRRTKGNSFIKPSNILVELPVRIKNAGLISGFLRCLQDSHGDAINCDFESLSLSGGDGYMEKNLELMSSWTDDLLAEEQKFQLYGKSIAKPRQEQIKWLRDRNAENAELRENGEMELPTSIRELRPLPDAPSKMEPSLLLGQLGVYTSQMGQHVDTSFERLYATSQLYATVTPGGVGEKK
jgi:translation initiation factor 3 subunit H